MAAHHVPAPGMGELDDVAFDERLPIGLQMKASIHFTPMAVARHAAKLLAPEPGMTVLDVGAGAGKFCLAAGNAVQTATFVGVELRGRLVRIASRLANELGLSNVQFIHGNAFELDWSAFDAFYFYNPFAEHLLERVFMLDDELDLDPWTFSVHVDAVRQRLAAARVDTRVATYHGFGGSPPAEYELIRRDAIGSDEVELWVKTRRGEVPA